MHIPVVADSSGPPTARRGSTAAAMLVRAVLELLGACGRPTTRTSRATPSGWAPCGRARPRGTRCSRWCGRRRGRHSRGSRRSVEVGVARAVVPRVVARRRRRGGAGGVAHRVVVEQNDPGHTSRCFAGLHCTVTLATPQGALQTTVLHTFLKCGVMASCAHRDSSARIRRSAGKAWREPHEVTLKHPGSR